MAGIMHHIQDQTIELVKEERKNQENQWQNNQFSSQ